MRNGGSLRSISEDMNCYPIEVIVRLRQLSGWEIPFKSTRVATMWHNQNNTLNNIYKERGQRWTPNDIAIARMEFQQNRQSLDYIAERLNWSAKSILYKFDEIFDTITAKNKLFEEAKIPLGKTLIAYSKETLPQD